MDQGMAGVAKRVLVVEDNELNLKLFCDLLRAHDYATEGVRDGRVIGTYVHGPLLPKNPWLADLIIAEALERRHGRVALEPLDDALELESQRVAATRG